ncbi:segregation and condensation protein A [Hugenholtzia roseola]|uniref:segregation and condensation protein A n=1 Tax=Hugenholtzia roseola TaxID=1002 RepID=UPI000403749D|nr:segregation/condensation protein A [Hugenholtzia roseola]
MTTYEVRLPIFEGAFDLLLFFIERDELDIHDIPIAKLTRDFLDYMHQLEKMNIELASQFVLVAAQLMQIKAKMLLPRPKIDEIGNPIDPRAELVQQILEYKRFKPLIAHLSDLEDMMLARQERGNLEQELAHWAKQQAVELDMQDIDLYKLFRAYQQMMEQYESRQTRIKSIVPYPYTVSEQKELILEKLTTQKRLAFQDLIAEKPTRFWLVFNLLAILELTQIGKIALAFPDEMAFNSFEVVLQG